MKGDKGGDKERSEIVSRETIDKEDMLAMAAVDIGLTEKQRRFVEEWVKSGNGTQSAIAAGYGNGDYMTCAVEANRLLNNAKIVKYVDLVNKCAVMRAGVTPERILREYAKLAFVDSGEYLYDDGTPKPLSEVSEDARGAIVGMDIQHVKADDGEYATVKKYKLADKKGALDSLAKITGMATERVAVGGASDMPPIETREVGDKERLKGLLFAMARLKEVREIQG